MKFYKRIGLSRARYNMLMIEVKVKN